MTPHQFPVQAVGPLWPVQRQPHFLRRRWAQITTRPVAVFFCAVLASCASPAGGDGIVGKTLEVFGLKAPQSLEEAKALAPAPRNLTLRMHAGDQLNTDAQMRSLSVVVRVYKLRRLDAFLTAPYATFGDTSAEKTALSDDVLEVRELVLRPGQKHEVVETMPLGASYLAVVVLFRAPADGRWRFGFDTKQAMKTGVTLGVHGCAMSVSVGAPERAAPETLRLAGVQCK